MPCRAVPYRICLAPHGTEWEDTQVLLLDFCTFRAPQELRMTKDTCLKMLRKYLTCVCLCVYVHLCVRMCKRASVRACVRVCVRACLTCLHACLPARLDVRTCMRCA